MQGQHRGTRRPHPLMWLVAAGIAVAAVVAVAVAGHGQTIVKATGAKPPASVMPSATASQAASETGKAGDTFTVSAYGSDGSPVTYKIALTQVDQHARLAAYGTMANPADHMAAVRFTVTGVKGHAADDALSNAVAIGKDTTTYDTSLSGVTDGDAFNAGEWTVGPGQTVSGWVPFELPPGQVIAQVQWTPNAGMGDSSAVWDV